MTLGSLIYRILIGPLELFFEVVFVIADRHVSNPAYAIILLSLAMNFLVLPLYRRADAVQAAERDREQALSPWIKHIKRTFKGDERFMMLQTFYRQNNYKPTDSLKGSISLLLEIPFFIAAYHFLSNLEELRGISFGPIADLGSPDALISIGSAAINLLPILMTLINVISAAIYMKGFPLKSKIQMYGIAAIFLVFLYNSPAGLVFYWTLNNLFSLIKNIFYKLKDPASVLRIISSAVGIVLLLFFMFVHPMPTLRTQIIIILFLCTMQVPLLSEAIKRKGLTINIEPRINPAPLFYSSCILLTILTGFLIPSSVIGNSPEEFIDVAYYYSPFWYLAASLSIAAGTFIVWFTIFYRLASEKGKQIFSILMSAAAAAAVVDYMFFGKKYGNFSSLLVYDELPVFSSRAIVINLLAVILLSAVIILIIHKKEGLVRTIITMACVALLVMSGMNIISINKVLSNSKEMITAATQNEPSIELTSEGKNVIVLMMDRQIGHFIPFIVHEKPELKEVFDGFTYYSNSFSYGTYTNVGSPGLYGGYDYIPSEMNKRPDEKLEDKHNESLKVMPRMFSDAGFDVSFINPTYAGYDWIPDLSVFEDIDGVKCSITNGKYSLESFSYVPSAKTSVNIRNRNFFCYSLFKISPTFLQPTIYQKGQYNAAIKPSIPEPQVIDDLHTANGYNNNFMDAFAALYNMIPITHISDMQTGSFTILSNDTPHAPMLLQEPDYIPSVHVDNSAYADNDLEKTDDANNKLVLDNSTKLTHYHINMTSMIMLGKWLEYLKDNNVYDNTRIIIVSDHGRDIHDNIMPDVQYTNNNNESVYMDPSFSNCTLLFKDFDSHGFTIDNHLVSNADTPALAVKGIINDPINPYTGRKLRTFEENGEAPEIIYTEDYQTNINNGNTFLPAEWFTLDGDIRNPDSWKYIGFH